MPRYIFLRCNSHRAASRLACLLGKLQSYYSWDRRCPGGFYRALATDWQEVRDRCPGVTVARPPYNDLAPCISFYGDGKVHR